MSEIGSLLAQAMMAVTEASAVIEAVNTVDKAVKDNKTKTVVDFGAKELSHEQVEQFKINWTEKLRELEEAGFRKAPQELQELTIEKLARKVGADPAWQGGVKHTYGDVPEIFIKEKLTDIRAEKGVEQTPLFEDTKALREALEQARTSLFTPNPQFHPDYSPSEHPFLTEGEGEIFPRPKSPLAELREALQEAAPSPVRDAQLETVEKFIDGKLRLPEPDPNVNVLNTLKVESVEQPFKQLVDIGVSPLLQFIQKAPATNTIVEGWQGPDHRGTELVRYIGVCATESMGETAALGKLINEVDRQLFFGNLNGADPVHTNEMNGLVALAHRAEAQGIKSVYTDYNEFSKRWKADKEFYGIELFQPNNASPIDEGDLPASSNTIFAVGKDAVRWRQLMPVMKMPLATLNPDLGQRHVYLIYGCLEVVDWDQLFIYVG
jgi:hypothetical protein